jgi:hypothetical protein
VPVDDPRCPPRNEANVIEHAAVSVGAVGHRAGGKAGRGGPTILAHASCSAILRGTDR